MLVWIQQTHPSKQCGGGEQLLLSVSIVQGSGDTPYKMSLECTEEYSSSVHLNLWQNLQGAESLEYSSEKVILKKRPVQKLGEGSFLATLPIRISQERKGNGSSLSFFLSTHEVKSATKHHLYNLHILHHFYQKLMSFGSYHPCRFHVYQTQPIE